MSFVDRLKQVLKERIQQKSWRNRISDRTVNSYLMAKVFPLGCTVKSVNLDEFRFLIGLQIILRDRDKPDECQGYHIGVPIKTDKRGLPGKSTTMYPLSNNVGI